MGQFHLQPAEGFLLGTLLVPADQVAHVLTDVFVDAVLSHVGRDEVAEGAAEADRHGCGVRSRHGFLRLWFSSSIYLNLITITSLKKVSGLNTYLGWGM